MVIGGASPEGVAIPELGVAPPDDSGTDLQDELLTPEDSMLIGGASPEGVVIPELGGTDLEDELFSISPLPPIVSPLTEPGETLPVSPSLYLEPRFLLNRTLFSVSSRGLFHSGKRSNFRCLTYSRRYRLPLNPTMIW